MLFRNYNFYDLLELYKVYARARGFSIKTIHSTEVNLKMIARFLNLKTPIKKFNEKSYENFLLKLRSSGYTLETIYDLNATLRKLVNLAVRKRIIRESPLKDLSTIPLISNEDYRLVFKEEFLKIRGYFKERGEKNYELFFLILYYTGIRVGEALALEFSDYRSLGRKRGGKVFINKSYLYDFKIIKEPKNKKNREIPVPAEISRLILEVNREKSRELRHERIFQFSPTAANEALKRVARAEKIPEFHCHSFRHTYISNLIRKGVPLPVISYVSGDTQKTILKRYSHMFEEDKKLVLEALRNV